MINYGSCRKTDHHNPVRANRHLGQGVGMPWLAEQASQCGLSKGRFSLRAKVLGAARRRTPASACLSTLMVFQAGGFSYWDGNMPKSVPRSSGVQGTDQLVRPQQGTCSFKRRIYGLTLNTRIKFPTLKPGKEVHPLGTTGHACKIKGSKPFSGLRIWLMQLVQRPVSNS